MRKVKADTQACVEFEKKEMTPVEKFRGVKIIREINEEAKKYEVDTTQSWEMIKNYYTVILNEDIKSIAKKKDLNKLNFEELKKEVEIILEAVKTLTKVEKFNEVLSYINDMYGKPNNDNIEKAQEVLLERAKLNGLASMGQHCNLTFKEC